MIVFNGVCSDDVGIVVEHYPKIVFPERKITVFEIPGRNGDQIIDQEVYSNYEQSYEVFFDVKDRGGLPAMMPQIASWLLSGTGYQRLEDSYFPEFYRWAYVKNAGEFLSYFNEYGRGTLTFNCQPEKYYKYGEKEITVVSGQTLYNPTSFRSYPIYDLSSLGNASATIKLTENGVTRTVNTVTGVRKIDVKNHFAGDGGSNNSNFTDDFDKLRLGKETTIVLENAQNSSTIKITPNWWTI